MTILLFSLNAFSKKNHLSPQAKPPSPFVPSYTQKEALNSFKASECYKPLAEQNIEIKNPVLDGVIYDDGTKEVLLEFEIHYTSQKTRVCYSAKTKINLDPITGKVNNQKSCLQQIKKLLKTTKETVTKAETSEKVISFISKHKNLGSISAYIDFSYTPVRIFYLWEDKNKAKKQGLMWE